MWNLLRNTGILSDRCVSFDTRRPPTRESSDDDDTPHGAVEFAEILVDTRRGECAGESLPWLESSGGEGVAIPRDDGVGDRVLVRPGHGLSSGDDDGRWIEDEVVNGDSGDAVVAGPGVDGWCR